MPVVVLRTALSRGRVRRNIVRGVAGSMAVGVEATERGTVAFTEWALHALHGLLPTFTSPMAALALPASRPFLQVLGIPFARPLFAATTFLPAFFTAPTRSGWALPSSLQELLELLPSFDLAVPKKKTSHSRKAMRSANKGLKDKRSESNVSCHATVLSLEMSTDLVHCPGCGSPKLAHNLCPNCYSSLSRGWKAMAKDAGRPSGAESSAA